MPQFEDSFSKINKYFASVSRQEYEYKDKIYSPRWLWVRPNLFRGYTCPSHCGGCCPRFSLDYLPAEYPNHTSVQPLKRFVDFNSSKFLLYSDMQLDHDSHFCRNLNMADGRCNIHGQQPFSCDFELIRFDTAEVETLVQIGNDNKMEYQNEITLEKFGRGHLFKRVDGGKGSLCDILPETTGTWRDVIRKLKRLQEWTEYFKLKTCMTCIIDWAENGYHNVPLVIPPDQQVVEFRKVGKLLQV